jgi:hypothetical protein
MRASISPSVNKSIVHALGLGTQAEMARDEPLARSKCASRPTAADRSSSSAPAHDLVHLYCAVNSFQAQGTNVLCLEILLQRVERTLHDEDLARLGLVTEAGGEVRRWSDGRIVLSALARTLLKGLMQSG